MGQQVKVVGVLTLACLAFSCQTGSKRSGGTADLLKDAPVVGEYVQVGNDKVFTLNPELLKDTISIPLSNFIDDLEVIKLDNRDEALVSQTGITISDNYIVTHSSYPPQPYKLFDRKGNYINTIGSIGQGPGEYKNVYDVQIDEPANRVYLLPWMSRNLLAYDLKGVFIEAIPLNTSIPKGKFRVDSKNGTVSVVCLPFQNIKNVAWTQDMKGTLIDSIPSGHLALPFDFSNEVMVSRNDPQTFDVLISSVTPTRADTLYHFDTKSNRLRPVFTYDYKDKQNIPWHMYSEWPEYFTGNTSGPPVAQHVEGGGTIYTPEETAYYIVDKESGKGSWFKMYNDFLGDEPIRWPNSAFANGYYLINNEPGNLIPRLEKALKNPDLTEKRRKELTDLLNSIDENDNNYLLIGKLKS